jgi:hypothetical protein
MLMPFLLAAMMGGALASHRTVSPEEVIPVRVKLSHITEIEFPKSAEIITRGEGGLRFGDPHFWDITADRNMLYIRPQDDPPPTGGGRSTTIIATLVDGRRFQIVAQEISKEKGASPDYHLIADFGEKDQAAHAPEYVRIDALTALRTENALLQKFCQEPMNPKLQSASVLTTSPVLKVDEVATLNGLRFFDYQIYDAKGKFKDYPVVLFHNDRFTFVALHALEMPTVSALREGHFVKVQSNWVANRYEMPLIEEGIVTVGAKDSFKFRIRSSKN